MGRLRMKRWGWAEWRWLPAVAAVVGVLGLLWVILVVAPPWFVPDQSLEGLRAQNEVHTTLLQGLGGAALLVGAYVTYRQLQTSREGQITERFTRAIDQLGSVHLDVRLGGLYALERIARDSPADRASIGEVLTALSAPMLPGRPATGSTGVQPEWRQRTEGSRGRLQAAGALQWVLRLSWLEVGVVNGCFLVHAPRPLIEVA